MKFIQLSGSDKLQMPIVGLGTWRAQPQEVENAVTAALNAGYRHIGKFCFMHGGDISAGWLSQDRFSNSVFSIFCIKIMNLKFVSTIIVLYIERSPYSSKLLLT